jgi:hypothetical protein
MNARHLELGHVMDEYVVEFFSSAIKVVRCDFDF